MTVTASSLAFFWINNVQDGIQETVGSSVSEVPTGSSRLNIINMRGDGFTVQNVGSETVSNVSVLVNGELNSYDLDAPLAPGEAVTITFDTALEQGLEHTVQLVTSDGTTTSNTVPEDEAVSEAGYSPNLDTEADNNQELCENSGYIWFSGYVTGNDGNCCGDDAIEYFSNITNLCYNAFFYNIKTGFYLLSGSDYLLNGTSEYDYSGYSVGSGDFNCDSIDDALLGARWFSPNGATSSGQFYVNYIVE